MILTPLCLKFSDFNISKPTHVNIDIYDLNGNKIIKANIHLKKLSLKGFKSDRKATFPEKKLPDQKKDEAINKTTAKARFFDIYLSTKVIRDEVSKRLPPFF